MKALMFILVIILAVCNKVSTQTVDSVKFKSLPPKDFNLAFQKEPAAILIDVREPFEFRKSRIKGAINIPSSGKTELAADSLSKSYSLFLYCTSGFRSKRVAKIFCNKGFENVYSLDGGINAWRKAKLGVERKR